MITVPPYLSTDISPEPSEEYVPHGGPGDPKTPFRVRSGGTPTTFLASQLPDFRVGGVTQQKVPLLLERMSACADAYILSGA